MKNPLKLAIGAIAAVATTLALAPAALAAPTSAGGEYPIVEDITPAAYVDHLESMGGEQAQETLEGFQALNADDQEKFLDYLQDPEILEAVLDEASGTTATAEATRIQVNDDVVITTGSVVENEQGEEVGAGDIGVQNLAPGNWITRYWVDQNVMGVTITRLELSLHYTTNGSAVTATSAVETAHVNYNFVVNVSSNSHIHYVTGSNGFASAIWNGRIGGSVGGINFGIDIDKRHELTVNAAGFLSGSLYNI